MELTITTPWSPKMLTAEFREDIPEEVTIHIPPVRQSRDAFLNTVPWIEITVVIGAAANLVTIVEFIWRKFGAGNKPVEKVIINRREEIRWTKKEITRVITETLEQEKSDTTR